MYLFDKEDEKHYVNRKDYYSVTLFYYTIILLLTIKLLRMINKIKDKGSQSILATDASHISSTNLPFYLICISSI